ncbi:hypothetical protein E1301_Tti022516 [Triplophysa tibetana]|uniref:Uncharacterized protein n=1 Tax=Triplophysa tibetana TaxID=1572043 RepID=A0A5A9NUC0_9TELE|nr:hypothetical protein E1301_Tti022516 [Triplophysa tibetana]
MPQPNSRRANCFIFSGGCLRLMECVRLAASRFEIQGRLLSKSTMFGVLSRNSVYQAGLQRSWDFLYGKASVVHAGGKERQGCETAERQVEMELFRSGWLRNLVLPFYQPESDEPAVSPLCAAELQEAHYSGVKLNGSVNKVVPVNCSDFELKEVVTYEGTGDMKVTLWDPFVNATEATKSYAFKNLWTRDRGGCIYLSTGPSSVIEPITDLTVAEDKSETSQQE